MFVYIRIEMVVMSPKYALICAEVLRDYCKENYSPKDGRCPNCIFSYPGRKSCYLQMFVGIDGTEMQEYAQKLVDERYDGIRGNRNGRR